MKKDAYEVLVEGSGSVKRCSLMIDAYKTAFALRIIGGLTNKEIYIVDRKKNEVIRIPQIEEM